MKDISYWLNINKQEEREGFLWLCIEYGLGLKFGVNEKYRLIWELEGINFDNYGDLWKATRDFCYRYYPRENKKITEAEESDKKVHKLYGKKKHLHV